MDIVCFCHLRWNFVYQRPQHLMSRFARQSRVFVIEEPLFDTDSAYLNTEFSKKNIWIITPHLPFGLTEDEIIHHQQKLLRQFFYNYNIRDYIAWYYTPLMLDISEGLPDAKLVVYDCMDELSAFKNAHPALPQKELLLFQKANLVFTGGYSLYEAKQQFHRDIFPFPSSIDKEHFSKARENQKEPFDQSRIPHPRIGFFGVIDERLDIELIKQAAALKQHWHFVLIGPVVKIDPTSLPKAPNIHYLGSKTYDQLPSYLSGWDAAMIPFALNESTQFISPTKTPEYLAGGIPVVSTPIRDVVNPYGANGLVYVASTPEEFILGLEWALVNRHGTIWLNKVDLFLEDISWDITWEKMMTLIQHKGLIKETNNTIKENEYV